MSTAILWLRTDLRLADNAALIAASRHERLVPIFILEHNDDTRYRLGAASAWWLHHSLRHLDTELRRRGSRLLTKKGEAGKTLIELARETEATHIYWNRRYEPAAVKADDTTAGHLRSAGLEVHTFSGHLLFEPGDIQRADGGPLRVFAAFWKACLRVGLPDTVAGPPVQLPSPPNVADSDLGDLDLLPRIPWDKGLADTWIPGEEVGLARLSTFVGTVLGDYGKTRDLPHRDDTSRMSPHLHFGEITPRQILAGIASRTASSQSSNNAEAFVRQLVWREFAHHLLSHYPHTVSEPLNPRFASFPWRSDYTEDLDRWSRGTTGIPLVDAGMRQLWQTGWMHNRVRMVVASFLTKNLLIPWQEGAAWFHDTLVDADLANNVLGWQWVAGSGADAAPYFRIFNPVLQGEKFDPDGAYVKRWVPELATMPAKFVHRPWTASDDHRRTLNEREYPPPMVDLKASRERALGAYRRLMG